MSSQPTERSSGSKKSPAGSAGVLDRPEEAAAQLNEDRDTLVKIFHQMLLIRRFEEKCAESYSLGKIGGVCGVVRQSYRLLAWQGRLDAFVRRGGKFSRRACNCRRADSVSDRRCVR